MVKKNLFINIGLAVFLFGISFVLYVKFSYMGAANKEIEEIILSHFKWTLALINLKILLAYVGIALFIALFSIGLKIERPLNIFLFGFFVWLMFWVRGVKLFPQLFKEQLFTKSFVLKSVQVYLTDFIPIFSIYAAFILMVLGIGIFKKRIFHALGVLAVCLLMIIKIDPSAAKPEKETGAGAPNVLIIATDSLRSQSISFNGYHRKTPHIDHLFSQGASFLNAKSNMGRTLPAWTSILTSTWPPEHGMRHMFPAEAIEPGRWKTLVDIFNKNGYYTAVVSDFAGDLFSSIPYGFKTIQAPAFNIKNVLKQRCLEIQYFLQGFLINPLGRVIFPEIWGMSLNKDSWFVTRDAKSLIKTAVKSDKPFFILSFTSTNHFPYCTNYPYYQVYSTKKYHGRHKYGLSNEVLESFLEAPVHPDEREEIVNLYDNGALMFDDNVGELLDYLKACSIDKNTIVVVMSDHGENLYEHFYGVAHGEHLYGEYANNIVLGIYSPFENFGGRRIKESVRDIDIAPTILALSKLEIPGYFRGENLVPAMRGEPFAGLPAYMETGFWYSSTAPFIPNRIRIPYPGLIQALEIQMPSGRLALKPEFQSVIIRAKYRAYQLNEKKYIFMPGESAYKEEFLINEKPVSRENVDSEFLLFKQKMAELFKERFYIDADGFIREEIAENPPPIKKTGGIRAGGK